MIPFLDLRAINLAHRTELLAAFERVLEDAGQALGWLVDTSDAADAVARV